VTPADSLRFDIVDHVMLIVHADVPPDDGDWARMVVVRNGNRDKIRSNLVIAPPRATINAGQRADVARFMKETGISIAVVTDSALIRGIARAVGFLGVQVRAYAPAELPSALNYLVVPQTRHDAIIRRIDALKAQLAHARGTNVEKRA
jgi:2,3-bisphosphoglycerate-independent phosphoglycerate mutase